MRALLLLACGLASACTPEVVAGAYFCGPEELCPDDLFCDGATNICVSSRDRQDFACVADDSQEPNELPAQAVDLGDLECTTRVDSVGCIAGGDLDFYRVEVPDNCGPRKVVAQLLYPVAFEPLVLELQDLSANATIGACPLGADENGQTEECATATVPAGGTLYVRVAGLGMENCQGACAYNRYGLGIQLSPQ